MHMPSGSCIPLQPCVVTICGPAGSGKSMLAKAAAAALGDGIAARVPTDDFFLPRELDEPLSRFLLRPLQWDWQLLGERLRLPIGTMASTPDVDFKGFLRRADTGGLPLPIRPVMFVDAMEPFPGADLVIRLDVPAAVRRARIVERDERWGTRVIDRWAHLEASWAAHEHVVPDLALDGEQPLADNTALVCGLVGEQMGIRQGGE